MVLIQQMLTLYYMHFYSPRDHKASQTCKVSNTTLSRVPALGIYYPSCPPYQDPTWPYSPLVSATLNPGGKGRRICSTIPCSRKEVKHLPLLAATCKVCSSTCEETHRNKQSAFLLLHLNLGIKLIPKEEHFYFHLSRHLCYCSKRLNL